MGPLAVSEVVLVPFPFSDLSASKLRPALLLAYAGREDWLCLQITSRPYADPFAIEITPDDFVHGSLQRVSYIRPGKVFTAHQSLFQGSVGRINPDRLEQVRSRVVELIQKGKLPD
ncbi:MAG TPA: MazF family transcriptional regulator [Thiotrichales bacterium]|nr:MazF family transcriptional regulator [Thiotrichales bacterium]